MIRPGALGNMAVSRADLRDTTVRRRELTDRQREVYEIIQAYLRVAGEPPTLRLIARRLQIHPSTVADHLDALARKGWLDRAPGFLRRG